MKKILLSAFIAGAFIAGCPSVAFAQGQQGQIQTQQQGQITEQQQGGITTGSKPVMATLPNPLKVKSISELFYDIVDFIISLSYVVIAFFFLLSGFKFVTAQGSDEKLGEAKRMFFNTVIGALIIIGANTIVAVVRTIIANLQA